MLSEFYTVDILNILFHLILSYSIQKDFLKKYWEKGENFCVPLHKY